MCICMDVVYSNTRFIINVIFKILFSNMLCRFSCIDIIRDGYLFMVTLLVLNLNAIIDSEENWDVLIFLFFPGSIFEI